MSKLAFHPNAGDMGEHPDLPPQPQNHFDKTDDMVLVPADLLRRCLEVVKLHNELMDELRAILLKL